MGANQAPEEKLCSGGGGAGRETMLWKQHVGGVNRGTAKRQQEGGLGNLFVSVLFVCCCFIDCFLASAKKGRFSQLCVPRERKHYFKNSWPEGRSL